MKIKYIICFVILFLFFQCKTNQLNQLKDEISESYTTEFNGKILDKSRKLLYKSLSEDIFKNDTIILLEYFTSENLSYYYTLYQSNDNSIKRYVVEKKIEDGKIHLDSLRITTVPDKILKMVRDGKLNEIKKRGDSTTLTPAATLIINIGVKNKEMNRFDFTTLVTQNFAIYDD